MNNLEVLFGMGEEPNYFDWLLLRDEVLYQATKSKRDRMMASRAYILRARMERMLSTAYQVKRKLEGSPSIVEREQWRYYDKQQRQYRWRKFWQSEAQS